MAETSIARARRLAREKRERREAEEKVEAAPPPEKVEEEDAGFFGSFFNRGETIDEGVEGRQRRGQSTDESQ